MHRAYSTVYSGGLAHRSCMSFSWCIHPKHMEEKWKPFWLKLKFILNQSSKLLGNCRCTHAHKFTSAFPHTRKDTRISPMYARVFVLSAPSPCGLAACMDRREEASVLLNVVFHHITVKVSTGDWWWITSPPLLRVFPQPVTYSNAEPSSPSLLR